LGDPEDDERVVLKYLRIARPKFKQHVISIETLLDVSTLSIEEVTGWLKAVEDDGVETSAAEGKLLLIEEEWVEKNKKKEGDGSRGRSNGGCGGRGCGGGGRGCGRDSGGRGDGVGPSGARSNNNRHHCGKPGHWPHDCRNKQPKKKERAFTAQE
jgi:uncharacterized membrane protein YgcG